MPVQKKRKLRKARQNLFAGVTKFLYITTQICLIIWISISYSVAIYATIKLGQPLPVVELSGQAMGALICNGGMKTVSNLFEHNNGGLFGKSDTSTNAETPTI